MGDFALFTDRKLGGKIFLRCDDAISGKEAFWKQFSIGMRWIIDKIYVNKPVRLPVSAEANAKQISASNV